MNDGTRSDAPILTPDQRLRVFVSSTLEELSDERRAVARAVSALRLTPVMFESGARPYPPRRLYRAYLAQSDIFIGLYWERYGWVARDMRVRGSRTSSISPARCRAYCMSGRRPRTAIRAWPACSRASHRWRRTGPSARRASSPGWSGTIWRPC